MGQPDCIRESAAEVAALIPRAAWTLMSEAQRDALMRDVVLSRYNAVTNDDVKLGPKWWAEAVGATAEAIRQRVKRLRQSQKPVDEERSRALSSAGRHAKTVMRDRQQRRQVLDSLSDDEVDDVLDDVSEQIIERANVKIKAKNGNGNGNGGEPTTRELMDQNDPFDPSEHWSDKFIITLGKTSREMEGRIRKAGGVILGSLSHEKAIKYLTATEHRVASARAALQEQVTEEKLDG